jgi:hypothetical protein
MLKALASTYELPDVSYIPKPVDRHYDVLCITVIYATDQAS